MTPNGPPSWFRWRGLEQRITASAGPERLAAEWWGEEGTKGLRDKGTKGQNSEAVLTRDYFKIQDEHGRWLWIYRVLERGCWFVHGVWA